MRLGRRSWISAICSLLVTVLLAGTAGAHEDRWTTPSGVYLDIGGGSEYVNLPEVTAYSRLLAGRPFSSIEDEFWLWSAEAAVGFVDGEGMKLPDPIGRNARIELRVRYSYGVSDRSETGDGLGILAPDGSGGLFLAIPNNRTLTNTSFETWEGDLTYQTDIVQHDVWAVSPVLGLTYTRLSFDNDFKHVLPGIGSTELNDETRAHYYGAILGADLSFRPLDGLDLTLGLRADLMGAAASMNAKRDVDSEESDNDQNFAARGTLSLEIGYTLGPITLGVEGFARYLSYLPVPDHRTAFSDRPTNIDGREMWSAGGRGQLTIRF